MGVKIFGVDLAKASEAAGVGADIASANTIAPTDGVHAVTGTGLVKTITPPAWLADGGQIRLIPEGVFTSDTTGNVGKASTATMTWDGTKFWPSY
jgi:hypothetical protein